MLLLFETVAGFAIFEVRDEGKLSNVEDFGKVFTTLQSTGKMVTLKAFEKFRNGAEALEAVAKLVEGKPSKGLCDFLKANCEGEALAVADSKLGKIIQKKLKINCVHSSAVKELVRGVRTQLSELIEGFDHENLAPMSLGLSHSLARYTLKFSPDKVDTMIIQAIGLLDNLDKELNAYAMTLREWYGSHFPELAGIVKDIIPYAKCVKVIGNRINAATTLDFSEILHDDDVEVELKNAVVASRGTEVSYIDLMHIWEFCDQVLSLAEYRDQLYDYLTSRMKAVAPKLTDIVGVLVGARLISHAGSLLKLSKLPGSSIQILGAEKALFRAIKTSHATPKYGLIYHASVVSNAKPDQKGKEARKLAGKASLACRTDAFTEVDKEEKVEETREKKPEGEDTEQEKKNEEEETEQEKKNKHVDEETEQEKKKKKKKKHVEEETEQEKTKKKKRKHVDEETEQEKKKQKKRKHEEEETEQEKTKKKKKKKKKKHEDEETEEKKTKKKKKHEEEETEQDKTKKKKKKKKKHEEEETEQDKKKKHVDEETEQEKKKKKKKKKKHEEEET